MQNLYFVPKQIGDTDFRASYEMISMLNKKETDSLTYSYNYAVLQCHLGTMSL